jgi:hypothetical protein
VPHPTNTTAGKLLLQAFAASASAIAGPCARHMLAAKPLICSGSNRFSNTSEAVCCISLRCPSDQASTLRAPSAGAAGSGRQYMKQRLNKFIEQLTSNVSASCMICRGPTDTRLLCQLQKCYSNSFNYCTVCCAQCPSPGCSCT